MKKILYFIDYPLDLLGGAQLSTQSISDELSKDNNFCPIVVTPKLMDESKSYNYNLIQFELNENNILLNVLKRMNLYLKIIKNEKPDYIHAQMPLSAIVLGIMKKIGLIRNAKLIFTDRALFYGYSRRNRMLFKIISKKMDTIICTTNLNASYWSKILPPKKIKVIYNSVSPDFIKGVDNSKEKRKSDEILSIGFAGRITDFKDWPLSITICKELKKRNLEFRVNCVMSAYTQDEKLLMQKYVQQFQEIVGNEKFSALFDLKQSKMANFYNDTDVFILTSKFESFGKTAIEAMRCGCTVVATRVGGLPEVVGKDENLFEATNYAQGVDLLETYVHDRNRLTEDQMWFKKRYFDLFDIANNIDEHKKLYLR